MGSRKDGSERLAELIYSAVMESLNKPERPKSTRMSGASTRDGKATPAFMPDAGSRTSGLRPTLATSTASAAFTASQHSTYGSAIVKQEAPSQWTSNDYNIGSPDLGIPQSIQAPAPIARMVMQTTQPLKKHEVAPGLLQKMSKFAGVGKPQRKKARPFIVPPRRLHKPSRLSATHDPTPKSETSFLDLPENLRRKIYFHALVDDDPISLLSRPPFVREPVLLRTCRRIRVEALPVFYAHNAFNSRFHYDIRRWLHHLSPVGLKLLQCVQLTTPQPAGFVSASLMELTEGCKDDLNPEAVSVPMQVQGEKGWLTWVTLNELDGFEGVRGGWDVGGPIRRKSVLKRKREGSSST